MAGFPLLKLGVMAVRQVSKPMANHLKERAKNSEFFRNKICIPPAQLYHWCEVKVKSRLLNLGSPKEVAKLNEQAAIDLGAELLGDVFIFIIGSAAVIAEYTRQSRKAADEKAALEARFRDLQNSDEALEIRLVQLQDSLNDLKSQLAATKKK